MGKREIKLPDERVYIVGLLVDCPYKPNPADCALHDIRKRPLKERLQWAKQLTDKQIQHIISVHKKCMAQREANNNVADE